MDILLRRADLDWAINALQAAGFSYRQVARTHLFLDGPEGKVRDAVHVLFAEEKTRPDDNLPAPKVTESHPASGFRVLNLQALVRMELSTCRAENGMHIRDLIDVGLIDATWLPRLPAELAIRLKQILDTPEG